MEIAVSDIAGVELAVHQLVLVLRFSVADIVADMSCNGSYSVSSGQESFYDDR